LDFLLESPFALGDERLDVGIKTIASAIEVVLEVPQRSLAFLHNQDGA
jgi:hypothetical protein